MNVFFLLWAIVSLLSPVMWSRKTTCLSLWFIFHYCPVKPEAQLQCLWAQWGHGLSCDLWPSALWILWLLFGPNVLSVTLFSVTKVTKTLKLLYIYQKSMSVCCKLYIQYICIKKQFGKKTSFTPVEETFLHKNVITCALAFLSPWTQLVRMSCRQSLVQTGPMSLIAPKTIWSLFYCCHIDQEDEGSGGRRPTVFPQL